MTMQRNGEGVRKKTSRAVIRRPPCLLTSRSAYFVSHSDWAFGVSVSSVRPLRRPLFWEGTFRCRNGRASPLVETPSRRQKIQPAGPGAGAPGA